MSIFRYHQATESISPYLSKSQINSPYAASLQMSRYSEIQLHKPAGLINQKIAYNSDRPESLLRLESPFYRRLEQSSNSSAQLDTFAKDNPFLVYKPHKASPVSYNTKLPGLSKWEKQKYIAIYKAAQVGEERQYQSNVHPLTVVGQRLRREEELNEVASPVFNMGRNLQESQEAGRKVGSKNANNFNIDERNKRMEIAGTFSHLIEEQDRDEKRDSYIDNLTKLKSTLHHREEPLDHHYYETGKKMVESDVFYFDDPHNKDLQASNAHDKLNQTSKFISPRDEQIYYRAKDDYPKEIKFRNNVYQLIAIE